MRYLILYIIIFNSCSISFKGTSIPLEVKTFQIESVVDNSFNAPGTYTSDFQNALSNKIRRETKLKLNEKDPDIIYKCQISNFNVSSKAPAQGTVSSINRLEIVIQVQVTYPNDESQNWNRSFSRFTDFDAGANFSTVQSQLINSLNKLLTEDIFIASFSNW